MYTVGSKYKEEECPVLEELGISFPLLSPVVYRSAFNCVFPEKLFQKLSVVGVNEATCFSIVDFL